MNRTAVALSALLLAKVAFAAPFADPTQPPIPNPGELGAPAGQRIESILIAPDRRLAVIGGQQVTIGSRVGSGTVVRITETDVVIRSSEGEQTLKLFPEVVREAFGKKGRAR